MSDKVTRIFNESFACSRTGREENLMIQEKTTTVVYRTKERCDTDSLTINKIEECSGIESCGVRKRSAHGFSNDWSKCPRMETLNTRP